MGRRADGMVRVLGLSALMVARVPARPLVAGGDTPSQAVSPNVALVAAVTRAREVCYAAPDCPNLQELMALFTANPRRTEIQRNNSVVQLEGAEALRADHLRVAQMFTGRRLETLSVAEHGRNVIVLQLNWDPGAAEPNAFTSVFRIEDGRVAHWVLVAP